MSGKHVAVLMGGFSSERPVSLSSGAACADALEAKATGSPASTSIATSPRCWPRCVPDVVFNALHGPFGEDGTIQGILEYLEIPYTHSGVLASALAMNKEQAKRVAKAAGIPVAESKVIEPLRDPARASDAAALCGQAGQRRLELRRRHRQGRPVASAADHHLAASGATATPSWSSATSMAAS